MIRLETARLLFRDHEPEDLEAYCAIESDPIYRAPQRVHPRAEIERSFVEAWLPVKAMGLLATVLKESNTYIGRCGLYPLRDDTGHVVPREANIAYHIARPYWGRGLATEAARAFVEYGFGELHLRRIVAGINAENVASIRVARRAGFDFLREGAGGGSRWVEYQILNPHPE